MKRIYVFLVAISLFLAFPIKAFAGSESICHVHSEACYESQYIVCNDEKVMEIYNQDFFCNTCQRTAAARVVIERYSCKYDTYVREARRSAYCYNCNSVVMYQEGSGKESHTRIGDVCICGLETNSVVATVSLAKNSTEWTNGNVLLTANVSEKVSGVSLSPYTYKFSGGTVSGNTCSVSENGSYTVTVTGKTGQKAYTSIQVSNIDKVAPIIEKCYVDKEYPEYESANIIVKGMDALSGLADKPYSFDGGKTFVASNMLPITKNGSYTIYVKDKAGNYAIKTIEVNCFEVKPVETETTPEKTPEKTPETTPETIPEKVPEEVQKDVSKDKNINENNAKTESLKETIIKQTTIDIQNINNKLDTEKLNQEAEKENLVKKLENSMTPLDKIPGVYSSLMKQNAEKYAPSSILFNTDEQSGETINTSDEFSDNEMENITIRQENGGVFFGVSKGVALGSVLLCIGMVAFLLVFLVKKL